jgi:hypothetical protein
MVRTELQEMDNSGGADPDRSRDDLLNAILKQGTAVTA